MKIEPIQILSVATVLLGLAIIAHVSATVPPAHTRTTTAYPRAYPRPGVVFGRCNESLYGTCSFD